MRRVTLAAAGVMALAGCAPAAPAQARPVLAGVTTHFSQGWPPRLLPVARDLGAGVIRDSVHWPAVETVRGRHDFTPANSGHVDRACAGGTKVLLGLEPRNPLYDGRQTAFSAAGRAGFAAYVQAVAARWPGCVIAVEVGNEINGERGIIGPAAADRIAAHVALLRTVRGAVKPDHPGLALLGGSTNTIATGFLAQLFRAGMLDLVDGIAIHPYRDEPEGVEREIARLCAAMRAAGGEKPIWATEFSRDFARAEDAAPFYLKMRALMEGAGVQAHLWYALADQPHFPTMGLVRFDGSAKPAARAFAFAQNVLAPAGPAVRIDHGDPALYHFAFGPDVHVVWGAQRALVTGAAEGLVRFFRADSSAVTDPGEVGEAPLVIVGARSVGFGPSAVLADSLYGFGQAPLAWLARGADGRTLALAPVDWGWTGYLGHPALPAAVVNPAAIGAAPGLSSVVRYVAKAPGRLVATACFARNGPGGALVVRVERDGKALWSAPVGAGPLVVSVPVQAVAGTRIDLVIAPAGGAPARLRYRFRITAGATDAAPCPEELTR